jgi:hypothetical protein
MTIFDANTAALNDLDTSVRVLLEKTDTIRGFEPLTAADANLTARISGKYLHSRHAPVREAQRLIASLSEETPGFIVLIGLGFGYTAEQCLHALPDPHVYIVVPDTALFKEVLHLRDIRHILRDRRVTLLIQPEPRELIRCISGEGRKSFSILPNRGILQLYPDYCRDLLSALEAYRSKTEINENTLIRFGETWVKNVIHNMQVLETSGNIRDLRGSFGSLPKLLLAAGPSLDAIRPRLSALRKRCIVIAVDTTARFCAANGLEPDFLVVVDPQYWNTRHLDRFPFPDTLVISEPSTHPRTFRLCRGRVFMGGSVFPLGSVLEQAVGKRDMLGSGGSVATTAWDFARYLGPGTVYCAGLDLGYPEKQTHFAGSYFEARVHYLSRRTNPAETMNFSYLHSGAPYYTAAAGGGKVLTDKRLAVYAKWFEQQLAPFSRPDSQPETYTLSPNGTAIAGMETVNTADVLELPEIRDEIDGITGKLRSSAEKGTFPPGRVIEAFRDLREELRGLENTARRGIELSKALLSAANPEETSSILEGLQTVDTEITTSPIKEIAGFLLQKTAKEVSGPGSGAENSLKLYTALKKSIQYHIDLISRLQNS